MYANPTDIKKGKKYIISYVEILNLKILGHIHTVT